ncbi:MAG TPA: hypothetical protein VF810_04805 [Patescibacteria group bacterium]
MNAHLKLLIKKLSTLSLSLLLFLFLHSQFPILHSPLSNLNCVYAASPSLTIQPSLLQIKSNPPAEINVPFTLSNPSTDTLTLKILFKRFRDEGTQTGKIVYSLPSLTDERSQDPFLQSVEIVDDGIPLYNLILSPNQQKQLSLRIKIEETAPEADHYFSVIFQTTTDNKPNLVDPNASFSQVEAGIALPVLLSIHAPNYLGATIDTFSSPLVMESGPLPLTVKIKNPSEHFVTAKGTIFISNMFGQTVGRIDIPPTNILANTTRLLTNFNSDYQQPKVIWDERFLLGLYQAKLSIIISPDKILYTRYLYFAAFPFIWLASLVVGCLAGFFILRRIKNKVSNE